MCLRLGCEAAGEPQICGSLIFTSQLNHIAQTTASPSAHEGTTGLSAIDICHHQLTEAMAGSDGEYVGDLSDDDLPMSNLDGAGGHATRSTGPVRGTVSTATKGGDRGGGNSRRRAAWEDIQRSWDTVVEGADGSLSSTVEGLLEAGKRQRYCQPRFRWSEWKLISNSGYCEIPHPFNEASYAMSSLFSTSPSP
jgi:hypothetical protein